MVWLKSALIFSLAKDSSRKSNISTGFAIQKIGLERFPVRKSRQEKRVAFWREILH